MAPQNSERILLEQTCMATERGNRFMQEMQAELDIMTSRNLIRLHCSSSLKSCALGAVSPSHTNSFVLLSIFGG